MIDSRAHSPTLDLAEQNGDVFVVERQAAAEQGVQNHAAGPDVHFRAGVHPPRDDFRGSVVGGAAGCVEKATIHQKVGQSKIRDLDVVVLVE